MTDAALTNRQTPALLLPDGKSGLSLRIRTPGIRAGQVSIGCIRARIDRSCALLDLAPLPDGEYPAYLCTDGRRYLLAQLEKRGGALLDVTYAPERTLALAERCSDLERRLSEAEKTIEILCEKIGSETVLSL